MDPETRWKTCVLACWKNIHNDPLFNELTDMALAEADKAALKGDVRFAVTVDNDEATAKWMPFLFGYQHAFFLDNCPALGFRHWMPHDQTGMMKKYKERENGRLLYAEFLLCQPEFRHEFKQHLFADVIE